jgi:hypothetical protein
MRQFDERANAACADGKSELSLLCVGLGVSTGEVVWALGRIVEQQSAVLEREEDVSFESAMSMVLLTGIMAGRIAAEAGL